MDERIRSKTSEFFSDTLRVHGPTPLGLDWNSAESQEIRFRQLVKVFAETSVSSIIDYGCGYGSLVTYLRDNGYNIAYHGFDICSDMIECAKELYSLLPNCSFYTESRALPQADYTVASGVFNMKFDATDLEWQAYILSTLHEFDTLSRKGFAFNSLTSYSDKERMRPDLYYADPCWLFDYCKTHFSRNVALLHDYQLYDFTILVQK